ncbi:RNA polymerase-binding protein RbpA [Arthrobacter sp. SD76]|uniref:RNA polymerase-binding protein RbpA n=1 Tax=Arthrobacter sp. SD76 TaxID=3415007 RepID=UPI003C721112
MVHPASGFRGTRAGVTAGSGSSLQSGEDHGAPLPRIKVSYWCAKGHETQPVFLKLPEDQIPVVWDCRRCGAPATRDGHAEAAADALDDGYKSHLEYVKEDAPARTPKTSWPERWKATRPRHPFGRAAAGHVTRRSRR